MIRIVYRIGQTRTTLRFETAAGIAGTIGLHNGEWAEIKPQLEFLECFQIVEAEPVQPPTPPNGENLNQTQG